MGGLEFQDPVPNPKTAQLRDSVAGSWRKASWLIVGEVLVPTIGTNVKKATKIAATVTTPTIARVLLVNSKTLSLPTLPVLLLLSESGLSTDS